MMVHQDTIKFLSDLKQNNNKTWFDGHKKAYQSVKENYLNCATDLLMEMQKRDHTLDVLTPKDCIFRINRDVRFSPDKSPYKTNLGIVLHPHGKKFGLAAYYLHIEPGHSFVGGGLWMPEPPLLNKVRKELDYFFNEFKIIIDNGVFKRTYGDLDIEEGQKLIRPPKGYLPDHPAIEYLKLKSFTASVRIDDQVLMSKDMVKIISDYFMILQPFLSFINRGLMSDEEGGL